MHYRHSNVFLKRHLCISKHQNVFLTHGSHIFPSVCLKFLLIIKTKRFVEMPGIEPGAFHMQSERSTAELHPQF